MPLRNMPEAGRPLADANLFRPTPLGAQAWAIQPNHIAAEDLYAAALAEFDDDDDDEIDVIDAFNRDELNEEALKNELKKRHLSRDERHTLHKPKNDWVETPTGEVLRSAETLVVSDIIHKHLKK